MVSPKVISQQLKVRKITIDKLCIRGNLICEKLVRKKLGAAKKNIFFKVQLLKDN